MTVPVLGAPAAKVSFVMHKGLPFPVRYALKESGVAVPTPDYSVTLKFLDKPAGTVLLDASAYMSIDESGVVDGEVPDEQTAGVTWTRAFLVCQILDADDNAVLRLYGYGNCIETGE